MSVHVNKRQCVRWPSLVPPYFRPKWYHFLIYHFLMTLIPRACSAARQEAPLIPQRITIDNVKAKIQTRKAFQSAPDQQRLIFTSRHLEGDYCLQPLLERQINLEAESSDTIDNVKAKIQDWQHLIFASKYLEEACNFSEDITHASGSAFQFYWLPCNTTVYDVPYFGLNPLTIFF